MTWSSPHLQTYTVCKWLSAFYLSDGETKTKLQKWIDSQQKIYRMILEAEREREKEERERKARERLRAG